MQRFYFHLYNSEVTLDGEGVELPGLASARERATEYARSMASVSLLAGHLNLAHRIDVADSHGSVLLSVTFRDIVEISDPVASLPFARLPRQDPPSG